MQPPFTTHQFLDVFRAYNDAVWPFQVFLYALAVVALIAARMRTDGAPLVVAAILAFFWLWMGVVYHLIFFRAINPLATAFGVLFIAQGLLIAWNGMLRP